MASDSLQEWSSATTIAVTVLAFVSVCLRLLARYERKQKLWWDDWVIVFSMAWNLVVVGFIFAMIKSGMGLHANTIAADKVVLIAKFLVVAEVLYAFNLVWTKLSILLLYYRIFHIQFMKRCSYAIGIFVILWGICITFLFIFICVPVQKLWYPQLPGHCINQVGTWIANAVSTILTDLAILFLPIPQIWKLQLKPSEKAAVMFAFCLGFFVVFASAYRFTVLFSYDSLDSSYTLAPTVGWTAIEMSAGIVSACLPTILPALQLFTRILGCQAFMPSLFRGSVKSRTQSHSTSALNIVSNAGEGGTCRGASRLNRDSFYMLSDESQSAERLRNGTEDLELTFRPKTDDARTVTDVQGVHREDRERNETMSRGIRVQTEFVQTDKHY